MLYGICFPYSGKQVNMKSMENLRYCFLHLTFEHCMQFLTQCTHRFNQNDAYCRTIFFLENCK